MRNIRVTFMFALSIVTAGACSCDDSGDIQRLFPILRVDPSTLDFGDLPIGKERTLAVRLTNDGNATLSIASVVMDSPTDEFALIEESPTSLTPSQSVELQVRYTSLSLGEAQGTIRIMSDNKDGMVSIALVGKGVVPGIEVTLSGDPCGSTPSSMSFGTVAPGQTAERSVSIKSTGAALVSVSAVALEAGASGEWTVEALQEGGVELAEGESLTVRATYTPSDSGSDTAAIIFTTNVPSKMNIRIPICGVGAQPAICATPVPLDLGDIAVGVRGDGKLHISNCATDPVDVTGVSIATDAAHVTTPGFQVDATSVQLPVTLNAGDGFDVTVSYGSSRLGLGSGYVHATTSAATQPDAYFPITANTKDTCQILIAPERVVYNNVVVGASDRKNVLIANNGTDTCAVTRAEITMGGNVYTIVNGRTVPFELESGMSESFVVRYQPRNGGQTDNGVLELETGVTRHRVELLGNPPATPGCQLEAQPGFINFGPVGRNLTVLRSVDVRNVSETVCTLTTVELDPSSSTQFTNVQFAPGQIQPGERTTVLVNYRAPELGTVSGIVHIHSDDVDTPIIDVSLFGAVAQPNICVTPANLDFGSINNGTQDVHITACGAGPVTITDLAFTRQDPEFSFNNAPALPFTLQVGEERLVTVLYESLDGVGDSAIVTVGSDDPVLPTIQVGITAGPVIVPPSAGRYLYYWQINTFTSGESNIFRIPLQGQPTPEAYWGPLAGKPCTGCHGVSPDGRYVAVIEATNFSLTVIDTTTDIELALPFTVNNTAFFTWNPDVNTNPPYQFAYDEGDVVKVASIVAGYIGELQGANDRSYGNKMPSWGPNGKIAFARGSPGGGWGFFGPSEIMLVDEAGGVPVSLNGAGANGGANYYPAYHPNGDWIAFNHSSSAQGTLSAFDGEIWMVSTNQNGTVLRMPNLNCAPGSCSSSFPTWSIDGSYLSFSSNRAGGQGSWDLYVGPVDPVTGADLPAQNVVEANTPDFQHAARWCY